jgi:tetratricopeptide (TPR) repeat protein
MSLVVLLPSSSFFLAPYITKIITQGQASDSQLLFALDQKNTSALILAIKQHDVGSLEWLFLIRSLASQQGKAAYQLAQWYDEKTTTSEYKLKQVTKHQTEAIKWYQQSIRLHYEKAKISLAHLYIKKGEFDQAQRLLSQVDYSGKINIEVEYVIVQITLAIELGDESITSALFKSKSVLLEKSVVGKELLERIYRYKIINLKTNDKNHFINDTKSLISNKGSYNQNCLSSLQLFASTLNDLTHLDALQEKFKSTTLATFICLSPPRYFPKKSIDCNDDTGPITCDESMWQKVAETTTTRHIGYMNNQGGANVHLGIMYFDRTDNIDVFTHELTHLLGFIDEYPISEKHTTCQKIQQQPFSHNISILANNAIGLRQDVRKKTLAKLAWGHEVKPTTPILTQGTRNNWILGTPDSYKQEVGLFKAQTCYHSAEANENDFSAYKALAKSTHLEYYIEKMPKQYIAQLSHQSNDFLMPSFHYNIALALYKKGDVSKAKYWLNKSSLWEHSHIRKRKILKGEL